VGALDIYEVEINGRKRLMQLSPADAKRLKATAVNSEPETEPEPEPETKQHVPQNKARRYPGGSTRNSVD